MPGMKEWYMGAPGYAIWTKTMAETISASPWDIVPSIVAGPVEPEFGIDIKPTGIPASAASREASMLSASWARGAMVQVNN